jgi:general secretion pathway protein C
MSARVSAFVIWSLVAAVVVFWALRFSARPLQVPTHAVAIGQAAPPRGDLARLFGAAPLVVAGGESAPAPEAASRFKLLGVMAPRGATADQGGAYGLALIAVDGKPPRAYAVGSPLDEGLVLQSVGLRSASIGAREGARSVLLELPPPGAPATGMLPPPVGATVVRPVTAVPPAPVGTPVPPAGTVPGVAIPQPAMATGVPTIANQPPRDLAQ